MTEAAETAQIVVRPPFAWVIAVVCGLVLDWFLPLPFARASLPSIWLGATVFAVGLGLFFWAIATMTGAGSSVPNNRPTTTIVDSGPYGLTRNPIYLGMLLGILGLAIAFNTLWLLVALVIFVLVIRYGVVAREEVFLERKFGDVYRAYRSRVRRWV